MYSLTPPRAGRVRAMANALSVGVLIASLLLVLEMRHSIWPLSGLTGSGLALLGTFALMLTGLLVGLRWPLVGAGITIAAFVPFWIVNLSGTAGMHMNGAFVVFPIAAALQFGSWWRSRHDAHEPR